MSFSKISAFQYNLINWNVCLLWKLEMKLTKTPQPLKIVLGHWTLPKQAATHSNNKQLWQTSRTDEVYTNAELVIPFS